MKETHDDFVDIDAGENDDNKCSGGAAVTGNCFRFQLNSNHPRNLSKPELVFDMQIILRCNLFQFSKIS